MDAIKWPRIRRTTNTQLSSGYSFLFSPTSSCQAVNERTAMQMTAVYSCVRILGCWAQVRGPVEEILTVADQSLGGVSQGLAWFVEAGSVKRYGLASKGSALRQKVWSSGELGNAASCFVNLILTFEAPLNNQGLYRQTPYTEDGQRVLIAIVQTMRKR